LTLDATRVGRDASRVAEEVIAHLTGLVGAGIDELCRFHMSTVRILERGESQA
jgi:hypothetical protein